MSAEKKAFDQLELLGVPTDTFFSPNRAEQGAYTAQLKALKSKRNANARQLVMPDDESIDDQRRKKDLKELEDSAERICSDKAIPAHQRLLHLRDKSRGLNLQVRDVELQRFISRAVRKHGGSVDGYQPDDVITTPEMEWLVDGLLLAGDANLVVSLPKSNKTTFILGVLGAINKGESTFLARELPGVLSPIFIAGTDQPGHIWQKFLQQCGLADETGRRDPHIIKMFTRECPIFLDDEGIDVMVKAAEDNPGLIFILESYSTLTRPLQLEENSPAFADPLQEFCQAVAPYGATSIFIHHAGKGGQGKSATFSSRGTTALPAAASHLVDVARVDPDDKQDRRRIFKAEGRLSEPLQILATFKGEDGWEHQGDAEQVAKAERLQVEEDKLNDRQYTVLEYLRERWGSGLGTDQADLDNLPDLRGLDRNNRRRILDQLVREGLATSRTVATDKGRLKIFRPVDVGIAH